MLADLNLDPEHPLETLGPSHGFAMLRRCSVLRLIRCFGLTAFAPPCGCHLYAILAVGTGYRRRCLRTARHRQISDPADLLVVAPPAPLPTVRAHGCFFRRLSWMTRAYRSPNTPANREVATKPGIVNSARIVLGFFMALAYPNNEALFRTRSRT